MNEKVIEAIKKTLKKQGSTYSQDKVCKNCGKVHGYTEVSIKDFADYVKAGIKLSINILEARRKFLVKDKKGWNEKEKKVARTEITILEQLLEKELT